MEKQKVQKEENNNNNNNKRQEKKKKSKERAGTCFNFLISNPTF